MISSTLEQSIPGADHWTIWSVLITQAVTLVIFFGTAALARWSDRDKRARDTKRDVLLEVAPAIQRVYASLAELTNPLLKVDDFVAKLTSASGAVAKLTAVANDETLEAARKLMTALSTVMVRMMTKRVSVGTDLEAMKQLFTLWREEIKPLPNLISDFHSAARNEIPLPLDKDLFAAGLKLANEQMSDELNRLFDALTLQEAGVSRESQSGQVSANSPIGEAPPNARNAQPHDPNATFLALQQRATFWEYRFLNVFLVHRTQAVLDWLTARQAGGQPTTLAYYHAELSAQVVSPGERDAIVSALVAHGLVEVDRDLLVVTNKGLDYLQWRGPLQTVPG